MFQFARHQDPYPTGPDFGSSEDYNSSRYIYQSGPNNYPPPGGYRGYESERGVYPNNNVSPVPYRTSDRWSDAYENSYTQQAPYPRVRGHGSYQY